MSALDDVLRTVDLLYAAALDGKLWPAALDRMAELAGSVGIAVFSTGRMDAQPWRRRACTRLPPTT